MSTSADASRAQLAVRTAANMLVAACNGAAYIVVERPATVPAVRRPKARSLSK